VERDVERHVRTADVHSKEPVLVSDVRRSTGQRRLSVLERLYAQGIYIQFRRVLPLLIHARVVLNLRFRNVVAQNGRQKFTRHGVDSRRRV